MSLKITRVLEVLRTAQAEGRRVLSRELVPITHRFGAVIKNLRDEGHNIKTNRIDAENFEYWLECGK